MLRHSNGASLGDAHRSPSASHELAPPVKVIKIKLPNRGLRAFARYHDGELKTGQIVAESAGQRHNFRLHLIQFNVTTAVCR